MTDSTFPATCDTCSQEYRVPEPDKTYSCRSCSGKVRVALPACHICQANLGAGDRFCPECGVERKGYPHAEDSDPVQTSRRRVPKPQGPQRSGHEKLRRARASKEMSRALSFLKILRTFFRIGVFFATSGIVFGLVVLADNGMSLGFGLATLAIQGLAACVMLMGARLVLFQPFLWSLVYASLVTLNSAIRVLSNEFHIVWAILNLVWALAFWTFVPLAARARRLMEENPDLAAVRQMTGVLRRGDASEEQYAVANAQAEQRARKSAFLWAGGLAVGATAATLLVVSAFVRPSFESVWNDFQEDWAAGRLEQVAAHFPNAQRERERARLRAVVDNRGWSGSWPAPQEQSLLFDAEDSRLLRRQVVEASIDSGEASFTWVAEGKDWQLADLGLPEPDFTAVGNACLAAWRAGDLQALGALFENPTSASGNLKRMLERRDWTDLPEYRDGSLKGSGDFREMFIQTAGGEFRIRFRVREDRWVATSIKPPRR